MLYVGTSGYSFREWVGPFYPPKTPSRKYLSYYASRLASVEINHTFRRFPTAEIASSWAAETPESFRFSLKMHQRVTHKLRLKNVGEAVSDFMTALAPLGPRLGVVLFQLPPHFPADEERLKSFLSELPPNRRFAMEFRHPSWNEPIITDALRDAGVALCAADIEIGESRLLSTASHGYMRLRKVPPYTEAEVAAARRQTLNYLRQVNDLYIYMKHDDNGLAPDTILRLQSYAEGKEN
jgi:uncharacterized protein YecE (DUF72 family)